MANHNNRPKPLKTHRAEGSSRNTQYVENLNKQINKLETNDTYYKPQYEHVDLRIELGLSTLETW